MIDPNLIRQAAQEELQGSDLYLIDVTCSAANEIEVVIDSDSSVDIDSCVELSNAIESRLDRDKEDFQISVFSAGIGQPLRVLRQYQKLLGQSVEVLLTSGTKILATLVAADAESITIAYNEQRAEEGKKRKQTVEVTERYPLAEVKYTKEWLDFK